MDIHNPRHLKEFLENHKAGARKRLSQNFLIDGNVIEKILSLADLDKTKSCVIEIGPGPGALTGRLREKALHLTTIELDPLFASQIIRFHPDIAIEEDVMRVDFTQLIDRIKAQVSQRSLEIEDPPLHIVSNLPYHLSTDIVLKLLPLYPSVRSLTLMVQQEFAERLLEAEAGSKKYGPLTIARELLANCTDSFIVKPTSFYPRPSVRSRVMHLKLRSNPCLPCDHISSFLKFCHDLFHHRRKMLRAALNSYFVAASTPMSTRESTLSQFGGLRAEQLTLQDWLAVYRAVFGLNSSPDDGGQ